MKLVFGNRDDLEKIHQGIDWILYHVEKGLLPCPSCLKWKPDVLNLPKGTEYKNAGVMACCGECRAQMEKKFADKLGAINRMREDQDAGHWKSLTYWRDSHTLGWDGKPVKKGKKNIIGFLYIVRRPHDGAYKIGATSTALALRLSALDSEHSCKHEFFHAMLCQDVFSLEATIHKRLQHDNKQLRGEYFQLAEDDLSRLLGIKMFDGVPVSHLTEMEQCTAPRLLLATEMPF